MLLSELKTNIFINNALFLIYLMIRMMEKSRFGQEVDEYLSLKGKATRITYSSAFSLFLQYYHTKHGEDKGFGDYLDRVYAELKKPRREQRRIAEIELVEFINFLKQIGRSNNTIRSYFAAVQNFLKYKQITVSSSFIGNLPPSTEKPINHKHEWEIEQIKTFVDSAPTFRDKAIIACLFQSGLGVNELSQLDYGNIEDEYEKGVTPICLKLVRQKTGVEFKTFLGRDALKYLRLYLQTRKHLTSESPLFTKLGSAKRITTSAIQQRFSEIAKDLPFVKKKDLLGFNPVRPHSLRAAFKSRLTNKISDDLIEFWMGHTLGGVKDAYLNMPTKDLRELYMDAEKHLALEKTSRDEISELEKKKFAISTEIEQKIKGLETTVSVLQQTIGEQKVTIDSLQKNLEQDVEDITRRLWEKWLTELKQEELFAIKAEQKENGEIKEDEDKKWREEQTKE